MISFTLKSIFILLSAGKFLTIPSEEVSSGTSWLFQGRK
jgi:hypothetical protein